MSLGREHRLCEGIERHRNAKEQLLRASQAVPLNIAEGNGTPTDGDTTDISRLLAVSTGGRATQAVLESPRCSFDGGQCQSQTSTPMPIPIPTPRAKVESRNGRTSRCT